MHMADALLSPTVGGIMYAVSIGSMAYAIKKTTKDELGEKKLPMMAVAGAFIFAAQMINFTIPATGSSGHIGGGVLLSGLLGGYPALLTIASVLLIQCLFFADGGLLALGANIFNMGVVPCLIVYPLLYKPILKNGISRPRLIVASILSSIIGLQLGAFGVVLETLASGITELPFIAFVSLMQPIHLAIGIVEGIITAAVLAFVYQMRPELLESTINGNKLEKVSIRNVVIVLAVLAIVVGGLLSLFASAYPDGLEWSIENIVGSTELVREGSAYSTSEAILEQTAILPDYDFASGSGTGTSLSGIVGAVMTCELDLLIGFAISSVKKRKARCIEK